MCGERWKTIRHIVFGFSVLAKKDYIHRHNKTGTYMRQKLCQHYGIAREKWWYNHTAEKVTKRRKEPYYKICQLTQIEKLSLIGRKKLSAVIKKRKCFLIYVPIPTDDNISLKGIEKYLNYKNLEMEIARMWSESKTRIIHVIIGTFDTLPFLFYFYVFQSFNRGYDGTQPFVEQIDCKPSICYRCLGR